MARRRSDKGNLRWKGETLYWCGTVPVGTDEEGKSSTDIEREVRELLTNGKRGNVVVKFKQDS